MSGKPSAARLAHERDDPRVQRRLAAVVQLDRADADVRALLDQPAVEHGVHVAALVGVLVDALRADVLVGPDLAEALRVLLGAAAAQVAHRHRLDVHVDRVVGGVRLGLAAVPLAAVGLVASLRVGRPPRTRNVGSLLILAECSPKARTAPERRGRRAAGHASQPARIAEFGRFPRAIIGPLRASSGAHGRPPEGERMEFEQIGKYKILAKIGQGAMGEVYKAHDPILNRYVAIKTISAASGSDDELRKRFQREAQAAARLNHPNIITVFDFGEEQRQDLHGHGAPRGHRPQGPHGRRPAARPRREARDHGADPRRPRLRPRQGGRPPRPQARQHPHPAERPDQDHGLRPGAPRLVRDDAGRRGDGHAQLHVARAGARRAGGRALGHLLAGRASSTSCSPTTSRSRPSRCTACCSRCSRRARRRPRWAPEPAARAWCRSSRRPAQGQGEALPERRRAEGGAARAATQPAGAAHGRQRRRDGPQRLVRAYAGAPGRGHAVRSQRRVGDGRLARRPAAAEGVRQLRARRPARLPRVAAHGGRLRDVRDVGDVGGSGRVGR